MTTTITVETHDWPVKVTTSDDVTGTHTSAGVEQSWRSSTMTVEEVPANSSRSFYITNTRSLRFEELPAETPAPAPPADDPAP